MPVASQRIMLQDPLGDLLSNNTSNLPSRKQLKENNTCEEPLYFTGEPRDVAERRLTQGASTQFLTYTHPDEAPCKGTCVAALVVCRTVWGAIVWFRGRLSDLTRDPRCGSPGPGRSCRGRLRRVLLPNARAESGPHGVVPKRGPSRSVLGHERP